MCTLIAFVRCWPDAPLMVAANRDERLSRASSGPRWWPGYAFFAPRDDEAGGTWLGLHQDGLFVGVTNRAGTAKDARLQSRGALVVDALRLGKAERVRDAFAKGVLDGRAYNPFHLFYADTSGDAFVTWFDGAEVHHEDVPRGLAIVTERSLGGDDRGRTERVRSMLGGLVDRDAPPTLEELAPALQQHDYGDRLAATCIHVPEIGYGTRSSLLLDARPAPSASRWLWADGPPCTVPYGEIAIDVLAPARES
jgi:uncharacterized protein with NRDE domain